MTRPISQQNRDETTHGYYIILSPGCWCPLAGLPPFMTIVGKDCAASKGTTISVAPFDNFPQRPETTEMHAAKKQIYLPELRPAKWPYRLKESRPVAVFYQCISRSATRKGKIIFTAKLLITEQTLNRDKLKNKTKPTTTKTGTCS